MISCIQYASDKEQEWDQFVESSKSPLFFFMRRFVEYHRDRFEDQSLMFYDDNKLIAVLPASRHEDTIVSHGGLTYGGLLIGDKVRASSMLELFESLTNFCKKDGCVSLRYKAIPHVFQRSMYQDDLYALMKEGATLSRRDLSSVIDLKARPKISKGRKWLINKAKKESVTVSKSQDWQAFHALLSSVLSKHGASPVHSAAELEYLHSCFPENISLEMAEQNGTLMAATLLFKFNNITHTQYMATSDEGKAVGALDFLIENCIQDAMSQNQQYFSFGISTEENGTILNGGLIAQKESFGGRGLAIDTYTLPLDSAKSV
ncbi:hypothetical protein A3765_01815 [Oleiphilus sp. HI0130]|uniref:GNAT family N-acetyltransferase n=2 Tax=Oleiphilus sp. HI0079 TaxID=1822254 RepID=UPI0007C3C262|nr:GNAT family N-acetyltransferase [Oleiphilus sp. HI0079]KZZ11271.1 hypothetical protein A3750_06535 [Oleiphilus sp. HI0079]KZZ72701.1 hypothetical protein A3765_01815 [Oleiphilus sp. HI0130]KZZ81513.1 hypothetical protein A3767_07790 [Oleiphilus sp. HI0133]